MAKRADSSPIPSTPAGGQLAWLLERIAVAGEGFLPEERGRFAPGTPLHGEADLAGFFARLASRFGPFELSTVEARSPALLEALLEAAQGRKWCLACRVEEDEPHRIAEVEWHRVLDFEVEVREATDADGAGLAELERSCPIQLREGSMAIDRGEDYFAFARLMEDVTVSLGLVDGQPAGVNCGALRTARVDGVDQRIMVAIHTRIHPEHQGKGLWGALSRPLGEKYSRARGVVGSIGYGSVDNAAIQRGFAHVPEKWDPGPVRAHLDCTSIAGPEAGRRASPDDAAHIVGILNACHEGEEMYTPYTVDTLRARVERAPAQYSWEHIFLTANAVVGVWAAGESIRVITDANGERRESRRGVVLDYGFVPGSAGAEAELESLLRGWCARLAKRGLDTLAIFTSAASRGHDTICALARETEAFYAWTPGVPVPSRLAEAGIYVDAIYF